ncbi:AbrB/MazE/SpoVT family DNA-binding domain-containing protein [Geomonas paludis]|uniref:AbrB/MazE/SpoVT family DNA-binding domain-containing protein n=1 Tax=Geomonas paludis TaxID=2740185 RepID=A0A6V8N140_9BACT|nr:AbrB/MazE/SpoVT family DNA-binding domain-containing protein [Geomonas paludis]UPU36331.1 AbrB/MazE/SpoVT family DNA-binding domain-containing protein [Geomonas paludis]GFO66162.1 multidrug transporter MatE [Geomonas paludis]
MVAKAQKWGNSLAVRLPKSIAAECGIEAESPVEITRQEGYIVIKPIVNKVLSLDALLDGINEENLHAEVSCGKPVGRELL